MNPFLGFDIIKKNHVMQTNITHYAFETSFDSFEIIVINWTTIRSEQNTPAGKVFEKLLQEGD
jgi:hypothetical protein